MPDPLQIAKDWLGLIQGEALAHVYASERTPSHASYPHPLNPETIYHLATTGLEQVSKEKRSQ